MAKLVQAAELVLRIYELILKGKGPVSKPYIEMKLGITSGVASRHLSTLEAVGWIENCATSKDRELWYKNTDKIKDLHNALADELLRQSEELRKWSENMRIGEPEVSTEDIEWNGTALKCLMSELQWSGAQMGETLGCSRAMISQVITGKPLPASWIETLNTLTKVNMVNVNQLKNEASPTE